MGESIYFIRGCMNVILFGGFPIAVISYAYPDSYLI